SPTSKPPRTIAVLGGGLTGLTTAYYLTRFMPNNRITIYEASDRLGGWIDTDEVTVETPDGTKGTVLFERGARTIKTLASQPKWDDIVFFDLVTQLNLKSELRYTNYGDHIRRFIYYPDHLVDVTGPVLKPSQPFTSILSCLATLYSLLTEPLFKGVIPSVYNYYKRVVEPKRNTIYTRKNPLHATLVSEDVSIGHFFRSAFGRPDIVDNVLSAMIHGIYGGDVNKLSFRSSPFFRIISPVLTKSADEVTVYRDDLDLLFQLSASDPNTFVTAWELLNAEYIWFRNGFRTLTDALEASLRANPKVTIRTGEPVESVTYHPTHTVAVATKKRTRADLHDKVVSTIFAKTLASVTDGKLPTLAKSHAVSILVVNLWYPTPGLNGPNKGFGYLIPQSGAAGNQECVLGVLFDSDRLTGLERDGVPEGDTVPGTKLTVMMGGHLWDGFPKELWPSNEEAIAMAKAAVARHLDIPQAETDRAVARVKICDECIPQQYTNHTVRMEEARAELESAFRGRLAVAGGSYQPPGVLGSLRAGCEMAGQIADSLGFPVGSTGLGRFT
ncbi:hypothetical protein B0T26DRAFT_603547, partial [Lasiosphaeria miniovina]